MVPFSTNDFIQYRWFCSVQMIPFSTGDSVQYRWLHSVQLTSFSTDDSIQHRWLHSVQMILFSTNCPVKNKFSFFRNGQLPRVAWFRWSVEYPVMDFSFAGVFSRLSCGCKLSCMVPFITPMKESICCVSPFVQNPQTDETDPRDSATFMERRLVL